jgi:hypothetical protein
LIQNGYNLGEMKINKAESNLREIGERAKPAKTFPQKSMKQTMNTQANGVTGESLLDPDREKVRDRI